MATTLNESSICRLCSLEFDNGINIFESNNSSPQLDLIVNKYLPLKVFDDGKLPRQVCQSCSQSVKDISVFFDVLIVGQRRLRELWKEQTERIRKEKKQSELAENFPNDSDTSLVHKADGQPLFDVNHPISLAMDGREVPRRKPGRPRKPKPTEVEVEVLIADDTAPKGNEREEQPAADIVDPEFALEVMFKEAEEKRLTSGELSRMRRRRRLPQRFPGEVQGKELEAILKNEGVIEPDEENLAEEDEHEDDELLLDRAGEEESLKETDEENAISTVAEESEGEILVGRDIMRKSAIKTKTKGKVGRPKKRRFVCELCGKSFLHSGHLTRHTLIHNTRQPQFICLTCNETYATKDDLIAHQEAEQHTGEGITEVSNMEDDDFDESNQGVELKCASCEEVFAKQSALTNHIVEHHITENNNVCDTCGKAFTHPSSVQYHKEVAHSKSAYVCTICDKEFKHKQLLQRHSLVHSDDRPFICDVCGATFKTRANLYNHSNIHSEEKPFQCTYCDVKFSHKTSLILHTRWHTGEKPYTCSVCNKNFSQGGNLQEHMRIHTGEKPFGCDVCSKRFTTSSQHRLHMKRHTGERPWKCEYCGKDFLHKDSWKCHLRRHRGEKPFSCPVCSRTFTEQWALKKHVRLHTGEKPYSCNICSKAFSDLSNLQKHKKTHKNHLQPNMDDASIVTDATNAASISNDETENALSALTDGQHIFYVTADQTQLVISTIGSEDAELMSDGNDIQYSSIMENGVAMVHLDEDGTQHLNAALQNQQSVDSESVLAIVGDDDDTTDQMRQAIQITTEDGRRVTLIIPANSDLEN